MGRMARVGRTRVSPPKGRRNTLLIAGGALAALQLAPYGRMVLLPVFYLNTHLHELCHALATWLTGGEVDRIVVRSDGSGVTLTYGGEAAVIASAGYVGAAALGAAMVLAARTEAGARRTLNLLGGAMVLSLLRLVRGDAVGIISGIVWAALLLVLARRLRGDALTGVVGFLGLAQGLQSLGSLSDLLRISLVGRANSDAQAMAGLTGVPALAWAVAWAGFSVWLTGTAVATAYRHHRSLPQSRPPSGPVG